jgi:2'-5' RNA ligase
VRTFVAITLPISDLLDKVLLGVRPMGKVVEGKNLHLTLKFLGEVTNVEEIRKKLEEIVSSRFSITLKGMGAFPNAQNGRVLFVRAYPEDQLRKLAQAVNSKTGEIPLDHPFNPHITILRVKDRRNFSELISKYEDTVFLESKVTSFSLFESILRPDGPIYNEIQKYQLM